MHFAVPAYRCFNSLSASRVPVLRPPPYSGCAPPSFYFTVCRPFRQSFCRDARLVSRRQTRAGVKTGRISREELKFLRFLCYDEPYRCVFSGFEKLCAGQIPDFSGIIQESVCTFGGNLMAIRLRKIAVFLLSLLLFGAPAAVLPASAASAVPGVSYRGQVQSIGWQGSVINGDPCGTTGRSLRLEAIKVTLTGAPQGASITYAAYVQHTGWQAPVSGGSLAGTVGASLRMEAFRVTLSGLDGYAVRYRAYVQHFGWMAWQETANGTGIGSAGIAGTMGKSLRVEALEIKLVPPQNASIVSLAPASVRTEMGISPALPSTVSAALSDGSTSSVPVVWDDVDASEYAQGGDFTVSGTVSGTSLSAEAQVKVHSDTSWGDGTYTVGADIPAGTYVLTELSGNGGYLSVLSGPNGTLLATDLVLRRSVQSVSAGQILTVAGATMVPLASAPAVNASLRTLASGMYLVGTDIPAGTYTVQTKEGISTGWFYVLNDCSHTDASLVSQTEVDAPDVDTVDLENGQYIELVGCQMNW